MAKNVTLEMAEQSLKNLIIYALGDKKSGETEAQKNSNILSDAFKIRDFMNTQK